MFGPSGMIVIALALATALVLLAIVTFGALRGVTRTVTRSFWCPFLDLNVRAEFQEKAWDGKPVEVNRCTAFSPTTAITCKKLCLRMAKFPFSREETMAV